MRSVRVAERLALPTSVHGVAGSNPAGGEILLEPKRRFIAQSLSCSPFHRLEMTEILLKGRKTLTHPSIHQSFLWMFSLLLKDLISGFIFAYCKKDVSLDEKWNTVSRSPYSLPWQRNVNDTPIRIFSTF